MSGLELWAGAECTVNRVGERYFDQLRRTGSHGRLDDLDRLAELGVRAVRFPVLWERVAPAALEEADFAWTDTRLARLRELGIRPIVGLLHHGSGPAHTELDDPGFVELFTRYAELVARRYPWVEDYTPINEPLTTARFAALYGHWYPHRTDTRSFLLAFLNQIRGTSAAMRAIRRVNPGARLIQTEDAGRSFSTAELRHQANYENERRWLSFDLLFGRVGLEHPLRPHLEEQGVPREWLDELATEPCPPDLLGLNYYVTSDRFLDHRLERYPQSNWGGNGHESYADVEAVRVLPRGIRDHETVLVEAWKRYSSPLAITEVHLGCTREHQLRWFSQAWRGAQRCSDRGIDVRAVTLWSTFGSVDWSNLVTRDLGHYETGAFDGRAPIPRPTALAALARQLGHGETPDHPVLAGEGWWESAERLTYPLDDRPFVARLSPAPCEVAPVLVIGSGPPLRQAVRACERRGLVVEQLNDRVVSGRASPPPWAVLIANLPASAERAREVISRLPRNWKDLPALAFSSDLVFDGRAEQPYVESDPAFETAEGRAWQAWETTLSRLVPNALVIRTGPLLDPEEPDDALAQTLAQLERGVAVRLPDEERIAPTYVPHLLNVGLDLLIDGEHGLWHIASCSSCSPLQLARAAAECAGLSTRRLGRASVGHPGLSRGGHSRRALSSLRGWPMPELGLALNEYVHRFRTRADSAA